MPSVTIKRLRHADLGRFALRVLIEGVQFTVSSIKELNITARDVDVSIPSEHVDPSEFSTVQVEVLLYQCPERTDAVLGAMADKLRKVLEEKYFAMPRQVEVNTIVVNRQHCSPAVLRMQG